MFKLQIEGVLIGNSELKEFDTKSGEGKFQVLEFTVSARQRGKKKAEGDEFAPSQLVRVKLTDKFEIKYNQEKLVKGARVLVEGEADVRTYSARDGSTKVSVEISRVKDMVITKYSDRGGDMPYDGPPQEPAAMRALAESEVPF